MSSVVDNNMSQRINEIAPTLRVLLGQAGRPALVRWQADATHDSLKLGAQVDLTEALKGQTSPGSVSIEGLGTFVAQQPDWSGRLAGKVVFVTGAAQGFGAGIAEGLAREGALVVVADMNVQGAEATANRINEAISAGRCVGLAINVTDAESVVQSIHNCVLRFGGIDILISNAGVLKAGSVKTLSEKDFDFVTRVNYTGYFQMVKHVAPVMSAQHSADQEGWTDIIQINSKSGLEGSNKNSAYAGSKFGGIGLTQSFALELIADGIKVNSICPGNFFDGPLWSDPENGLFAQYLRAGKVPGAKTTDDVRHFYEAKVPMGRGCTVPDVLRAIYYLVEQQYETGQALPVTGGQVMLN